MNNDINSLSGIEFEILCKNLLENMGFQVETTKASGDGGIDLIAYNYQPIVSGKYIIQCKRYSGSVGEPIIRDLYGVITSERANKGVLITTGVFTTSAVEFARNKQIELINGNSLIKLLNQYNANIVVKESYSSFTELPYFDIKKYEFLLNEIRHSRKPYDLYMKMVSFLIENVPNIIFEQQVKDEFLDRCIFYCDKATSKKLDENLSLFKTLSLILKGDYENAFRESYYNNLFKLGINLNYYSFYAKKYIDVITGIKFDDALTKEIIIRNFLIIFKHYNFQYGYDYLMQQIEQNLQQSYHSSLSTSSATKNIELSKSILKCIYNGSDSRIFIPAFINNKISYEENRYVSFKDICLPNEKVLNQMENIKYIIES